jgi:tetratricopeptide (TPR) repeat protein
MKKSSPWPILITAALLIAGLVAVVAQPTRAPRRILEDVRSNRASGKFDDRLAHLDLNKALALAQEQEDGTLAAEILLERADLLAGLGSHDLARDDLITVLREGGVDGVARSEMEGGVLIEERIVELDIAEGRYGVGLRNVEALIERHPDRWQAWLLAGRLHAAIGAEREAACMELCERSLPRMVQDEARLWVRDVTARDQRDPLRAQTLRKLQGLFPPGDEAPQVTLLDLAARASDRYAAARHAWARSLAGSSGAIDGEAVNGLLDLLTHAGQTRSALDLGLVCLNEPEIAADEAFLRRLLAVMVAEGQRDQARDAARAWMELELAGSPETYEAICLTLYRAEAWGPMHQAQDLLRRTGDARTRSMANFYLGLSKLARERVPEAQFWLDRYLKNNPVEPFPGAEAEGYRLIARAHRILGSGRETPSLRGAVALEPEGNGEDWLRLAQIQTFGSDANWRLATQRQMQAMALLPRRWQELFPYWREYGEQSLIVDALDTEGLQEELISQDQFLPTLTIGSYGLFRIAEHHRDDGLPRGVVTVCNELLRQHPGFIPALDLIVEAHLDLGQEPEAAERLTQRLELAGRDAASAVHLERMDTAAFSSFLQRRLVEGDPARSGRVVIARELQRSGDPAAARVALGLSPTQNMDREERLLLAQLNMDLDRPARAREVLALGQTMEDGAPAVMDLLAFRLELQALLAEGEGEAVEARVLDWLDSSSPETATALPFVDELIERGATLAAQHLLLSLDGAPETRGGEVLIRLALTYRILGSVDAARECVERAEAFLADGRPELMRVLDLVDRRDWRHLPSMVAEVRASTFQPTPVQDITLLLFEERFRETSDHLYALREAEPENEDWVFLSAALAVMTGSEASVPEGWGPSALEETLLALTGPRGLTRDPRELLALRLAMDVSGWEPWITGRLIATPTADAGVLWPTWFGVRALVALDRLPTAQQSLQILLRPRFGFPPAWDLAERLLLDEVGSREDAEMVTMRRRRWSILGRSDADRTQEILDRVAALRDRDKLRAALELLEPVADDADPMEALPLLARLRGDTGNVAAAVEAWRRVMLLLSARGDEPLVAEFVRFLENVHEHLPAQLSREALNRELQGLARAFPTDPLPVVALARVDLGSGVADATRTSVARSLQRMEVFRRSTHHTPLEHLRPGVTDRWVRHLANLDTERAITALEEELDRLPGSVTLWRLLAELRRSSGDRQGALTGYRHLVMLSHDALSAEAMAMLTAEAGQSAREVSQYLMVAKDDGGETGDDETVPRARREFILALNQINGLRPDWEKPLSTLQALIKDKRRVRGLDREEVALALALAHLRRGLDSDGPAAQRLLEALVRRTRDPYRTDLIEALLSLAVRMRS